MFSHRSLCRFLIVSVVPLSLIFGCTEANEQNPEFSNRTDAYIDPANTSTILLPDTLYRYATIDLPAHFDMESERFHQQQPLSSADNTPPSNPITDEGATLGRVLFFDRNLSANRTVACASCHKNFKFPPCRTTIRPKIKKA